MNNLKEIVLYSENFKAQDSLISFAKKLGFNNIKDINCRMNKDFINFIKKHVENYGDNTVYKGKKNTNNKFGFDGIAYITHVNTEKLWTLLHDSKKDIELSDSYEGIAYLNFYQQKHNYLEIDAQ